MTNRRCEKCVYYTGPGECWHPTYFIMARKNCPGFVLPDTPEDKDIAAVLGWAGAGAEEGLKISIDMGGKSCTTLTQYGDMYKR